MTFDDTLHHIPTWTVFCYRRRTFFVPNPEAAKTWLLDGDYLVKNFQYVSPSTPPENRLYELPQNVEFHLPLQTDLGFSPHLRVSYIPSRSAHQCCIFEFSKGLGYTSEPITAEETPDSTHLFLPASEFIYCCMELFSLVIIEWILRLSHITFCIPEVSQRFANRDLGIFDQQSFFKF